MIDLKMIFLVAGMSVLIVGVVAVVDLYNDRKVLRVENRALAAENSAAFQKNKDLRRDYEQRLFVQRQAKVAALKEAQHLKRKLHELATAKAGDEVNISF